MNPDCPTCSLEAVRLVIFPVRVSTKFCFAAKSKSTVPELDVSVSVVAIAVPVTVNLETQVLEKRYTFWASSRDVI